ncbi:hypothetical protein [Xanthomonas melonis]|uniref:hypothetical protein n=1 Tax=Xanthomonas melonis TaxID=56456 RepID=UPI003EB7F0CD
MKAENDHTMQAGDALDAQAGYAIATRWRKQASEHKTGRATLIRCAEELEAALAAGQTAAAVRSSIAAIAEERTRQVQIEGMTPQGDTGYRYEPLAWAAAAYAQLAAQLDAIDQQAKPAAGVQP